MEKLTLVILAAGMGSRYGGLKQLDEVGPSGETVMDYSVFDAMRAGFDRVLFIIRRDIEEAFRAAVGSRYEGKIEVDYAFQSLDDLPGIFQVPAGRAKPWGTGQAVYAAREQLDGPFAVINADDFYGEDTFRQLATYLRTPADAGKVRGCIAAFVLENTLSENGAVSRGVCEADASGNLTGVTEFTGIERKDGKIVSSEPPRTFSGKEPVSMNAWGFSPSLLSELERLFVEFLKERGSEEKSEFYLPFAVDALIREDKGEVKVLNSASHWFGVTYREDKPAVQKAIRDLVGKGAYPERLFA